MRNTSGRKGLYGWLLFLAAVALVGAPETAAAELDAMRLTLTEARTSAGGSAALLQQ